jgi:hypothetical protein
MQRHSHAELSGEVLASVVGVLELHCGCDGVPLLGEGCWRSAAERRRTILQVRESGPGALTRECGKAPNQPSMRPGGAVQFVTYRVLLKTVL